MITLESSSLPGGGLSGSNLAAALARNGSAATRAAVSAASASAIELGRDSFEGIYVLRCRCRYRFRCRYRYRYCCRCRRSPLTSPARSPSCISASY